MRWAAAILAACLAQPAWSLSCVAPDIARDFTRAAESGDIYIVVKGDLFFNETALPGGFDRGAMQQREGVEIPAWLKGRSLTPDGFTKTFERDVILRVSCIGPWCGSAARGEHLAFLRQERQNWVIDLSPCPGMIYAQPTPEQEATVKACFRGEQC